MSYDLAWGSFLNYGCYNELVVKAEIKRINTISLEEEGITMKNQSSWIFLEHPNKDVMKTSIEEENAQMDIGHSVYSFISSTFPSVDRVIDPTDIFASQLAGKIDNCNARFDIHGVGRVQYLDVSVEGETEDLVIACLERIQSSLLQSGIKQYYVDINSYDAVSEHYCNMIVGYLNSFERNLRKLLFNTYVLYFRENYYQATMDENLQKKIKGLINISSRDEIPRICEDYKVEKTQAKAILYLKYFFYSLELGDAIEFIFSDKQPAEEEDTLEDTNIQVDLSKLPDSKLSEVVASMSSKSDWDLFFSSKIHIENAKEKIEQIRKHRNSVAHFKYFSKSDYSQCLSLLSELNEAILEAIEETKKVDFANRNQAIIKEILDPILKKWNSIDKNIRSYFEKAFYNAFRDTIDKLKNPPESTDDKDNQ